MDNRFSFSKGLGKIRYRDIRNVRRDIMDAFKITTHQAFRDRLKGKYDLRITEKEAVEAVFEKYGVTDIWGTN